MILSTNDLKLLFSTGNQANEDAFANLIDSFSSKLEDSLLLGPSGLTGTYGLIGPSGGTHFGLLGPSTGNVYGLQGPTGGTHFGLIGPSGGTHFGLLGPSTGNVYGLQGPTGGTHIGFYLLSATAAPEDPTSSGEKGQVIITADGATGDQQFMFIHNGAQWFRFEGLNEF